MCVLEVDGEYSVVAKSADSGVSPGFQSWLLLLVISLPDSFLSVKRVKMKHIS